MGQLEHADGRTEHTGWSAEPVKRKLGSIVRIKNTADKLTRRRIPPSTSLPPCRGVPFSAGRSQISPLYYPKCGWCAIAPAFWSRLRTHV